MSVVFGWYSFKIKSFNAEDLSLDQEKWNDSKFEVRQKVFHLFWLPLISLGKSYELRKGGELFEVPISVITQLKAKKVKTPWYAFFLPVILIVGLLGLAIFIPIAEALMRNENYTYDKERYETSMNKVEEALHDFKLNSYVKIVNIERPNRDTISFLKLIEKNDTNYRFYVCKAIIPYRSRDKYHWQKFTEDTITVTQSDFKKAVCTDYDVYKEKNTGFNFFGNTTKYIIDQIEYFDAPVIDGKIDWNFWRPLRIQKFQYYNSRFTGSKKDRSWSFILELQNFGIPANLIEIKNIENDVVWSDQLPVHIETYKYLKKTYIKGNTTIDPDKLEFTSKFIFEDSLKNKYEYIIKGSESWFSINRETNVSKN